MVPLKLIGFLLFTPAGSATLFTQFQIKYKHIKIENCTLTPGSSIMHVVGFLN